MEKVSKKLKKLLRKTKMMNKYRGKFAFCRISPWLVAEILTDKMITISVQFYFICIFYHFYHFISFHTEKWQHISKLSIAPLCRFFVKFFSNLFYHYWVICTKNFIEFFYFIPSIIEFLKFLIFHFSSLISYMITAN